MSQFYCLSSDKGTWTCQKRITAYKVGQGRAKGFIFLFDNNSNKNLEEKQLKKITEMEPNQKQSSKTFPNGHGDC